MREYIRTWLRRAVDGAKQAVGFRGRAEAVRTVVLWALSVVVLYSVNWRSVPFIGADDPGASSEVRLGLSGIAGILVVFALTFLWQLVVQPAEMDQERRSEAAEAARIGQESLNRATEEAQRRDERLRKRISDLEADIAAMLNAEELLQRLSIYYRDGRALYEREADPEVWSQRMNEWNVEVESIIRASFSISDVHRYQNRQLGSAFPTAWSWSGEGENWLKKLYSSRLDNLDELIRFGSPVNMARQRMAMGASLRGLDPPT